MERLTKRFENGRTGLAGNGTPCENMCKYPVVIDRLAAYEDTGLTPEVCAEYRKFEDEVVARGGMTFGEWAALMHAEKARKAND